MKHRPVHQNLDTSFVNLSALIKYLRRRQFIGNIKIQLNGYNADIMLQKDNQMSVREHDQISGRISQGEEALQRLLIRAREPGGTINVYQVVESTAVAEVPQTNLDLKAHPIESKKQIQTEPILEAQIIQPIPKPVETQIPQNGNGSNRNLNTPEMGTNGDVNRQANGASIKIERPKTHEKSLPDFPFSLTNKVEQKAKPKEMSVEDWQTLLKLTVEILTVVDKTLATANLDFSIAFRKARSEMADDYPFLNPSSEIFDYKHGKIKMTHKVNEKIFVSSITETLRRILEKLESTQKFENVHRKTNQTLIALMNKRKSHYDKFSITPHFKRILGL